MSNSRESERLLNLANGKGELKLLLDLSADISNFFGRPNKASRLKRTFVMRPGSSETFGLGVFDNKPTVGVPRVHFSTFMNVPWLSAVTVEGDGGLYLTFESRGSEGSQICALRLFIGSTRAGSLLNSKVVRFVSMLPDGEAATLSSSNYFDLPYRHLQSLEWERG